MIKLPHENGRQNRLSGGREHRTDITGKNSCSGEAIEAKTRSRTCGQGLQKGIKSKDPRKGPPRRASEGHARLGSETDLPDESARQNLQLRTTQRIYRDKGLWEDPDSVTGD